MKRRSFFKLFGLAAAPAVAKAAEMLPEEPAVQTAVPDSEYTPRVWASVGPDSSDTYEWGAPDASCTYGPVTTVDMKKLFERS